MLNVCLLLVALGSVIAVGILTKSILKAVSHLVGTLAISGLLLSAAESVLGLVTLAFSESIVMIVAAIVAALLIARSAPVERAPSQLLIELSVLGFSLLTLGTFIYARIQAAPLLENVFAGAGRIASAEDNAKWLNFASHVSTGELLDFKDGTTGGMAVLLMICVAASDVLAQVLFGGPNVTGAAIQGVLGAHTVVTVIAPMALIPVVGPILRMVSNERNSRSEASQRLLIVITLFSFVGASYWLTNSLAAVSAFGHLSLEYIIVTLAFWLAAMVFVDPSKKTQFVLITLIGSGVGLVWLPLPGLSIAIAIVGTFVFARYIVRQHKSLFRESTLYVLLANIFLTVWVTVPELNYLGAKTVPGVSTDLVVAEGGAMVLGRFEGVLLVLSLSGFLLLSVIARRKKSILRPYIYPVVLTLGFACAVTAYDFVVARVGFPHYGTRKLDYAFTVVLVAILIPVVVVGIVLWTKAKSWIAAALCVVFLFFIQGSRTIRQATPVFTVDMWTWFDWKAIDDPNATTKWFDAVNPSNSTLKSHEQVPIACVQIEDGIISTGVTAQYFCTRFLISLHGDESDHADVIVPLLQPASGKDISKLKSFTKEYEKSPVLVIDKYGQIINWITWTEYIELAERSSSTM